MCVVSSRQCWSSLYVPSVNTGHLHWRWTQKAQIPALGFFPTWDYEDIPLCHLPVFLTFPLRFTINLEQTFVRLILFHLDGQLIKKHLFKIYFTAHWYWVREWMNESHSVVSDSFQPHRLYSPWNSLGQNTGVGSLSFLKRIFPNQESNHSFLHCMQISYHLSYHGSHWY